ncbi:MAG: hypothetical protein OEZ01_16855 [Candidatus Heimdallarchaeota archaeon]|nr:hypothetical protein [Candidatus Heimdallarchaeota archaeon]
MKISEKQAIEIFKQHFNAYFKELGYTHEFDWESIEPNFTNLERHYSSPCFAVTFRNDIDIVYIPYLHKYGFMYSQSFFFIDGQWKAKDASTTGVELGYSYSTLGQIDGELIQMGIYPGQKYYQKKIDAVENALIVYKTKITGGIFEPDIDLSRGFKPFLPCTIFIYEITDDWFYIEIPKRIEGIPVLEYGFKFEFNTRTGATRNYQSKSPPCLA